MKCIFLHGLGQSADSWNDVVKSMGESSDSCCPELSEWLSNDRACYSDLYKGLEQYCAGIEGPLNLCGLSLGGILALQYGLENPDRVNSMVLIATQYVMPKGLLRIQNGLFRLMPKRTFRKMGFEKKDFISLSRSMLDLDFRAGLKRIRFPVLLICGEKDQANKAASMQMKEQISGAEFLTISGAGHEVNRDAPNELGNIIGRFFREQC